MLWDSHCHLSDARVFHTLSALLVRARQARISGFVLGGTDPAEWQNQRTLRTRYPEFQWRLSFGLHPWWVARQLNNGLSEALIKLDQELPEADALGELGLDYGAKLPPETHALQRQAFEHQLALAQRHQKPLILHIVRAHSEALDILKKNPPPYGRMMVHSYSGSREQVREYLKLGCFLSVSGAVTHPRFETLRKAVLDIPLERLLVETDCPDQPIEGQTQSEPAHLIEIARVLSELRGERAEEILEASSKNLLKFFGESNWNRL
jgi:TatD DNase family protein